MADVETLPRGVKLKEATRGRDRGRDGVDVDRTRVGKYRGSYA